VRRDLADLEEQGDIRGPGDHDAGRAAQGVDTEMMVRRRLKRSLKRLCLHLALRAMAVEIERQKVRGAEGEKGRR